MARGGRSSKRQTGQPYNEDYYRSNGYDTKQRIIVDKPISKRHVGEVKGGRVGVLRFLAGAQLVGGLIMLLLGIIMVALGPYNRALALLGGMSVLWCPLGAVATGIIGLFLTRRNTRDFVCLRRGFMAASVINAFFFMLILALTVGLIQVRLLNDDQTDIAASETLSWYAGVLPGGQTLESMTATAKQGYLALSILLIVFAILEMLLGCLACSVVCCGQRYYFVDAQPERMSNFDDYGPEPRPIVQEPRPRVMAGPERAVVPFQRPGPKYQGPGLPGGENPEYEAWVDEYYRSYYEDYERQVAQMKQPDYRWVLDQGNRGEQDGSGYQDDMPRNFRGATRSVDDYGVGYNPRGPMGRNENYGGQTGSLPRY